MNFEMSPDMSFQSCSSSDMYPIAPEDADLCSAMNDPCNYWLDDSWQWSSWPTTNASDVTAFAGMSDDSSLLCAAVHPMHTILEYNNTTAFGCPEQLSLAVSDCFSEAQPVLEAPIENTQPHDCQKARALEERIDSLEKLLASRETEPVAAFQTYAMQMQEWLTAFMERAEALAEEVRSTAGTSSAG